MRGGELRVGARDGGVESAGRDMAYIYIYI